MMWRWSKKTVDDGKLQLIEKEIYRALEPQNAEVETAATSPFFYRRLCAHIEAEARRRAEAGREWGAWLMTARQATPAFALVALLAVGVFWSAAESVSSPQTSVSTDVSVNLLATSDDSADELVAALADVERQDSNNTTAEPEKEQQ
jgi:hypothetical protein